MGKIKTYETDEIIVYWNAELCQHAAECVKGLPEVFEVGRRPWIMPDRAPAEEIARVIDRCPSGALSYEFKEK